jgi:serine O-acetyltransferase
VTIVQIATQLWKARFGKSQVSNGKEPDVSAASGPDLDAYFKTPVGRAELEAYFKTPEGRAKLSRAIAGERARRQPGLREAVWADAAIYSSALMEPPRFTTKLGFLAEALRLSWESDAFFCVLLYRVRTRLSVHKIPILPTLLHRVCMVVAQIDIGRGVVIQPGVYIPHGQVVIDGAIEIGSGTVIAPWVTLGRYGEALEGPSIGRNVFIGTGAKIFGPVKIGDLAKIGANAVVFEDIAPHATVVGVPGRVVRSSADDSTPEQPKMAGEPQDEVRCRPKGQQ